jgi:hypothetical protein
MSVVLVMLVMPLVSVMMIPGLMARRLRDNDILFRRFIGSAKLFKCDRSIECSLPLMLNVLSHDVVIVNFASKLMDTADHQAQHDDSDDRIRPYQTPSDSCMRGDITKAQGQNGNIAEIQRIGK